MPNFGKTTKSRIAMSSISYNPKTETTVLDLNPLLEFFNSIKPDVYFKGIPKYYNHKRIKDGLRAKSKSGKSIIIRANGRDYGIMK